MYSLKALVLEGCPYCKQLKELLSKYNIKTEYVTIPWNIKDKYKTKEISTFPQVYLIDKHKDTLIGGYSELKNIIDTIKENNYDNIKKKISSKYYSLSKKSLLRLIELFIKNE